jgi:hypothetical protein
MKLTAAILLGPLPEKALFIQQDEMAKEVAVRFGLFNLFKAAGNKN